MPSLKQNSRTSGKYTPLITIPKPFFIEHYVAKYTQFKQLQEINSDATFFCRVQKRLKNICTPPVLYLRSLLLE